MLLTTSDMLEVAGVTKPAFDAWVKQGIIEPVEGGSGQGNHRRFSLVQAVALSHAFKWRACGASLSSMGVIIAFVASHTEEQLLKEFEAGCRLAVYLGLKPSQAEGAYAIEPILLPLPRGPKLPKQVDLEATYREVKSRIAAIEKRLKSEDRNGGRLRGLAHRREN